MTGSSYSPRFPIRVRTFWPLFVSWVAADFVTKRIAEDSLALHVPRSVLGEFFRFTLTYNTGAAMNFSLGQSSRVAFTVIAAVMLFVIFRMYRETDDRDGWQAAALALIAAGALGNLLDRLRSARGVVDFIDVGTSGWRFWTFNVADMGVTVGAALLALLMWRQPRPPE
ncbi:MAG: signal peptidase II [Gemmatimonadetes bacterium]|nr:signal peptidase II [Gemmatimonadota bacterium]